MYSAASELEIKQNIKNGNVITKFTKTNVKNGKMTSISGIGKNGKAIVRKTIANESGYVNQQNYVMPEEKALELLLYNNAYVPPNKKEKIKKKPKKSKKKSKKK